ncbi:hypothetical protein [Algivirga pacifica]|uniref:FAS1 domain-containing protein n=1 Tax=Algivirga pacifica TaxID=1162670 RepID=A0ABP9DKA3_9BACT
MKYLSSFCIGLISFWLWSCNFTPVDLPNYQEQTSYFPLEKGHYVISDVKLRVLNNPVTVTETNPREDITSYQLMEKVGDAYEEIDGSITHELLRYKRKNEVEEWRLDSIWTARIDEGYLVKVEKGVRYNRLRVPIRVGNSYAWYLNNQSALEETERINIWVKNNPIYSDLDSLLTNKVKVVNTEIFNEQYSNNDDPTRKLILEETYAENIGLVRKSDTLYNFLSERFTFFTDDSLLDFNPYCDFNDKEVIYNEALGQYIQNPFWEKNCLVNPYYQVAHDSIMRKLIAQHVMADELSGLTPKATNVGSYQDTGNKDANGFPIFEISMTDPGYKADSIIIGREYQQKIIAFGVDSL